MTRSFGTDVFLVTNHLSSEELETLL